MWLCLNIFKTFKKLRKYVVNSLKYDYTNAMVRVRINKIKVIKRVSYGYRSFRNFKARIMLMERYKIQKTIPTFERGVFHIRA